MTCSEKLVNALKDGNLLSIGRIIRNGILSGTLSEVSLMEISKQTEPPKVPLMMNLLANENADLEDMKSYNAASIFLQNFPSSHEKPLKRLQKSVNSLTYSLKDGSSLDDIQHRSLDAFHIIKKSGFFVSFDLNRFYSSYVLIGEGAINQLISMLVQIFRKLTCPTFEIWKVTYYPRSNKNVDGNFVELPEEIIAEIQDFCYDVFECYLPDDLLHDPIDTSHEFMERLGDDPIKELRRRRAKRQTTTKSILNGVWQGLRTVRSYHYDDKKGELISCQGRKNCVKHIKWEQLKQFRESLYNNNQDTDDYTTEQHLQHIEQFPNTPRTDNRTRT